MLLYLALVNAKNDVPKIAAEAMARIPADVLIANPSIAVEDAIRENKIEN
jgi:hypothetical protein